MSRGPFSWARRDGRQTACRWRNVGTVNKQSRIQQAATAFQGRDLAAAEAGCRAILSTHPGDANAMHLLGLVRRQAGDDVEALQLIRQSIEKSPRNAEFRVNYSNLLRSSGRLRAAEAELRAALRIDPDSRTAGIALARVLNDIGRYAEAQTEAARLLRREPSDAEALVVRAAAEQASGRLDRAEASYRAALDMRPEYAIARHNYGALLCELQQADRALDQLQHATRLGATGAELSYNTASALFTLARFDEAEARLEQAVAERPGYVDAHTLLARLRFMRGDPDYTRSLAVAAAGRDDPALTLALGELLLRGGQSDRAAQLLSRLAEQNPGSAQILSSYAVVLQEVGQLQAAADYARRAHAILPDDADIVDNLVAVLLQLDEADAASRLVAIQRAIRPTDQRWLAYEATAARMSGRPEYHELYDYERLVGTFDLSPPRGFASIDDFHAELVPRLVARHQLDAHPLDQSLRNGTQTARDLRLDDDPVVRQFFDMLEEPLRAYRDAIGVNDEHPFLARNHGEHRFGGCWSVRLQRGGFHVNHIHPRGWISSAYYVEVPDEVDDDELKSGWIKFGEPRRSTPRADAAHYVKPIAGRLALFPSYMWHGTTPIRGGEPRMTIAFDVVDAAAGARRQT